jgi:hypothetical protein
MIDVLILANTVQNHSSFLLSKKPIQKKAQQFNAGPFSRLGP